jgi:predicted MFS family arabinose efflux permease
MSSEAAAPARPYVGPAILLTLTQAMISWAVFAPPVIAKQALPEMGLDPIWIGAQPTLVFIAAMLVGVLASSWVARINPMRATQLFVSLCVVGPALIATGSIVLVALGSLLIGAALGPSTPASSHILGRVTPPRLQPLIFSIRQSGVTLGGVLAGFVTPLLMELWDWQTSLLIVAAACAVTVVLVEIWVRGYNIHADPTIERRPAILAPIRLVLSIPSLRWLTLGIVPLVIAQYGLTTFLVLYLQEDIDLSVITAGWVLAAALASGGVGRIVFGMIAGRYLPPLTVLIYFVGIVYGAGAAGWNGVFLAEAARLSPPGTISRVTGGSAFFIFAGIVVGPAGLALLIEQTSFPVAYMVMAALLGVSVYAFVRTGAIIRS